MLSTNGTGSLLVYVKAAAGVSTRCYARSANSNGSSVQTTTSSRVGAGWISLDTARSAINGATMVYCSIARGTRLSTIRVGEFPNTAN